VSPIHVTKLPAPQVKLAVMVNVAETVAKLTLVNSIEFVVLANVIPIHAKVSLAPVVKPAIQTMDNAPLDRAMSIKDIVPILSSVSMANALNRAVIKMVKAVKKVSSA